MGLIYASSESESLIAGLTNQLTVAENVIAQLKEGSQNLIHAVNGDVLAGAAYTAAAGLFTDVVIPTMDHVLNAVEDIRCDMVSYKNADGLVSGEGYLDEDNLSMQLQVKAALKIVIVEAIDTYQSMVSSS